MRAWLLTVLKDEERTYRGNTGYDDDSTRTYRYDSFVPNHRRLAAGDFAILRDKTRPYGVAQIVTIESHPGKKERHHCPRCGKSKIKQRKRIVHRFRCECGHEFDRSISSEVECTLYKADFSDSFERIDHPVDVSRLWSLAPRLNKQHAILELETQKVKTLILDLASDQGSGDVLPVAVSLLFREGALKKTLVNRYERSGAARKECLSFHGWKCVVCGFDGEAIYGVYGRGVIHTHHLIPISSIGTDYVLDPKEDLVPVCPNCHAVLHTTNPPLSVAELRSQFFDD